MVRKAELQSLVGGISILKDEIKLILKRLDKLENQTNVAVKKKKATKKRVAKKKTKKKRFK